jgi:symplekin
VNEGGPRSHDHNTSQPSQGHPANNFQTVRARLLTLSKLPPPPPGAPPPIDADDDEYEPDFTPPETAEQFNNKLADAAPEGLDPRPSTALAPFKLPQAPPITEKELEDYGNSTIRRVFDTMNALAAPPKQTKPGFNRLAASSYDRDAWMTVIARLATRAGIGLGDEAEDETAYAGGPVRIKDEGKSVRKPGFKLGEAIREMLYHHIMADWRRRIDVATSWLSEEWYNDRISGDFFKAQTQRANGNGKPLANSTSPTPNYTKWVIRLLDSILPYLESSDKMIIRFLSEIPAIDDAVLARVKRIAEDPERVGLTVNVLHYLILFRPPVREACLGAVEDLYRNC